MAQRTVHYLLGEFLCEKTRMKDKNRFLLGSILPDAYSEHRERDSTHFICRSLQKNQAYFDFNKFREQYDQLIQTDDLYLGYYMHLVEDSVYRKFFRDKKIKSPCCREEVAMLHQDYHLLNSYVVKRYLLQNTMIKPMDFEKEPICKVAEFRLDEFLREMERDFIEKPSGNTHFLTESLLDEFIDQCAIICEKELQSVLSGTCYLQATDYMWTR